MRDAPAPAVALGIAIGAVKIAGAVVDRLIYGAVNARAPRACVYIYMRARLPSLAGLASAARAHSVPRT